MRRDLQLLGVTAAFIASKYQEVCCVSLHELTYMTAKAFNNDDVRRMETAVFRIIEFDLNFPTALSFVEIYLQAINCTDYPTELFTRLLLDLALTDLQLQRFRPSTLALATIYLAQYRISADPRYANMGLGPKLPLLQKLLAGESSWH